MSIRCGASEIRENIAHVKDERHWGHLSDGGSGGGGSGLRNVSWDIGVGTCVEAAIDVGVAENDLDIAAGFVEGDDFGELGRFFEWAPCPPKGATTGAGVVSG